MSSDFPKPWLKYYGPIPEHIDYPKITLYQRLCKSAEVNPQAIAWDFMGTSCSYKEFLRLIDNFADGLASIGFKKGDIITISMPTSPQGIIPIYAVNKLGGICSMIHPLSPAPQIEMYLNISKSRFALTLDAFYGKFAEILPKTSVEKLILCKIPDFLGGLLKIGFKLTKGRKIAPIPVGAKVFWSSDLMNGSHPKAQISDMKSEDCAIILYSGGTTGVPKGIMLSNMNMISEGMMVSEWGRLNGADKLLAILPIFHGFGLGVCVNACFMGGGTSILIPQFTPEEVALLIKKKRPTFLIGVPTLFESLANNPKFQQADLSCLKGCFSGADTLPRNTKEKFEKIVKEAGGKNVQLLEGYGLTEAVTAIMATPLGQYREGSIGVPFPDMLSQIVKPDTEEILPLGEVGELCVSGPAVMLGYLNRPEDSAKALRKHKDGRIWLHTGDLGSQDTDGFFYFKLRLKRMLKVSGMNVYPTQVEECLCSHPEVAHACVIGVPDKYQMSRVKAFIILKDKSKKGDTIKEDIIKHAQSKVLKWECPREIEFRDELPKTLVGKIAFNELEKEELAKLKVEKKYPFDVETPAN